MASSMSIPSRVKKGLLQHPLDDQTLVYDPERDTVHLLDRSTACVLDMLNEGGWTQEGMKVELAARIQVPADDALVALSMDALYTAGLLEATGPQPAPLSEITRRDLVGKLAMTGAAALLIPVVATLTATRAYAGTLVPVDQACITTSNCQTNLICCGGVCRPAACNNTTNSNCSGGNGPCCAGTCTGSPPRCTATCVVT